MMPKDRREYYKEWRSKNMEKIKTYIEDKYKDYAEHSANYRIKHPERVLCSMAKRRAKEKELVRRGQSRSDFAQFCRMEKCPEGGNYWCNWYVCLSF